MAIAFGEVYFLECYLRRIKHLRCTKTREVFEKLGILYGAWNIVEKGGEFRSDDLLSSDQISQLKEKIMKICEELKPDLITLCNVPDFPNYNIFGHEDFYEKLLGVLVQEKGAFEKAKNWKECIVPESVELSA